MSKVRVRYAPSPTGIPHIGNIRTALFNYLFARNQKGTFILRVEDTDQKRLVKGAVEKIKESLSILKLDPDMQYYQSKRLNLYKKHLEILKELDCAYKEDNAWRFKVEKGKNLKWKDVVHGEISFSSNVIEDFVIIKSDGFPTYHFASVVDDRDMQISHVFRGDEWISSTPKHLLLYQAFGWQPPLFVHIPPILGHNKKKLSKREGAKSVMEYIEEGYLPEALVNFMAFLGWAPKDNREIFSLEELVGEFTIDRINKNSPIFSLEKLNWFNMQWLKKLEPEEFAQQIEKVFPNQYQAKKTAKIAPLVNSRITTIRDFPKMADPFYKTPQLAKNIVKAVPLSGPTISNYSKKLESISNWSAENFRITTTQFANENNLETKDLYRTAGVATFGSLVTPPLPESVNILGKDTTVERLNELAKKKK